MSLLRSLIIISIIFLNSCSKDEKKISIMLFKKTQQDIKLPQRKNNTNNDENFPIKENDNAFLSSLIIKFDVPSAVFNAILPVKPSATITFTSPSII